MIYIVSGFMRSGTSAMMSALISGGMEAEWSKERDKLADSHSDNNYHPNSNGLYEVSLREYQEIDFPLKYQNKLIKVMIWGLENIAVNSEGYQIVIMQRDKEEIRQSYEAFFDKPLQMKWFEKYDEKLLRTIQFMKNRKDVETVDVINYRDLVSYPEFVLANCSFPFDYKKASKVIDKEQYRFRKELLTVGI